MQDGVVFANFNHQGGPRGGSEFVVPNWWMGMAGRDTGRGRVTLTGMLSLDPATVGKDGYREIFQAGEALDGQPLIDRQHPHDFFMQLAAIWRIPITSSTGLTFAGGPVGEPALGPVAFMHRPSAVDNPTAPLGHHTFDSTHFIRETALQTGSHIRTFPTRFGSLRQSNTNNVDGSILKNTRIKERFSLQYRAEFFNAFNHAVFNAPNLTPTSTAFGTISGVYNLERHIQMALRLTF